MLDVVLSLDWIGQTVLILGDLPVEKCFFLFYQSSLFSFRDIELIDLIQRDLMQILDLLLLIGLVLLDLELDLIEHWNQQLVLLLDDLLIRPDSVQHVEVIVLVHEGLGVESVVVLS